MPKADTLALVDFLSGGVDDPATINRYYDDTMYELARENWTCDAQAFAVSIGQQEVDLDFTGFVNLLGLVYDDTEIDEIPLRQLEMLDPYWRDAIGRTASFTQEDENNKVIALYPAPNVASNPLGGTFGEPLGGDYTTYNAVIFYSYPALDPLQPPYYLELVAALTIMAREFNRESDHPDPAVTEVASNLTQMFKEMLK